MGQLPSHRSAQGGSCCSNRGPLCREPPPPRLSPRRAQSSQESAPTEVFVRLLALPLMPMVCLAPLTQHQQGPKGENPPLPEEGRTGIPFMGQKQHQHHSITGSSTSTCMVVDMLLVTLCPFPVSLLSEHQCSKPGNRAGSWCIMSLSSREAGRHLYLEH